MNTNVNTLSYTKANQKTKSTFRRQFGLNQMQQNVRKARICKAWHNLLVSPRSVPAAGLVSGTIQ